MVLGIGSMIPSLKPVSDWVDPRRSALMGFSAGMLSGDPGAAMRYAMQGRGMDQQYVSEMQAREEAERERNATAEWLKQSYPQFANLPPAQGFEAAMKMMAQAQSGGQDPATVREWQYFSGLPEAQQAAYIRLKRANPYLDIGTGYVQPDPINPGQTTGGPIAKDNYTPKYDEALGAGQGKTAAETQADFESLNSKLPGLKSVVGELSQLAQTATYTQTGQLWDNIVRETGQMPPEGAVARTKYMAMVDNQVLPLLRDTFGAQFTVEEGKSLRATLGDPDKSPVEKQAILEAFIEQKQRDLEALRSRLPGAATSAPAAGPANDPLGIR